MERYVLAVPNPHQRPPSSSAQAAAPPARLKRPRQITHFSYDDTHTYRADASSLKYYYNPPPGASLSRGYPHKFEKHDDGGDEHLDGLLRAVADLERSGTYAAQGKESAAEVPVKLDVGLVTWRGMMTKILTAPYAERDGFEMNATCFEVYIAPPSGLTVSSSVG